MEELGDIVAYRTWVCRLCKHPDHFEADTIEEMQRHIWGAHDLTIKVSSHTQIREIVERESRSQKDPPSGLAALIGVQMPSHGQQPDMHETTLQPKEGT
jgi:hypothetical protein